MNLKRALISLLLVFVLLFSGQAQAPNSAYLNYINKYSPMAVQQMQKYRIPASITLAQGLLESAAGRSTLATEANNHFGIKTGGVWTGPYVVRDDDAKGEHFRKYNSAAESFEDHSQFLLKKRYAELFTLSPTDYKGWAHGLKRCGYATNPVYAESLISIIENYKLYAYDTASGRQQLMGPGAAGTLSAWFDTHPVMACNKNYYIIVQPGDNLEMIAAATGVRKRKLLRYNELPKHYQVKAGDVIYLEKKRSHAHKSFKNHPHQVQPGESIYDISQMYGITVKSIYKMNHLPDDYSCRVGDQLRVY